MFTSITQSRQNQSASKGWVREDRQVRNVGLTEKDAKALVVVKDVLWQTIVTT